MSKPDVIRKDVPVPVIRRGRPRKHNFDVLEVGESMVARAAFGTIYGCVRYYTRKGGKGEDRKFILRFKSDKQTEIWRTE